MLTYKNLLLLLSVIIYSDAQLDNSYEVINIKIPRKIFEKAFSPTPVLRSPATVTLPIYVSQEEEAEPEIEEDNEEDNDIQEDTPVVDTKPDIQNVATAAPVVTQAPPVLNDAVTPVVTPVVTGQVVRLPCSCVSGQCGCCTGSILERIRMKACSNITFIPEDFVFDVRMSVNNNTVLRRRVSASDPPPICFNPRRAPFVQVCVELSNIRIRNRNAHACLDINADIADFPVYSASFRCFSLGASGVKTGLKPKPVSSGPETVSLFGNNNNDDDDDDDDEDGGGLFGNVADFFGGGDEGGIFGGGGGDGGGGGGIFGGGGGGGGGIFGGGGGLFGRQ